MKTVALFLDKFKRLTPPDKVVKEKTIIAVQEVVGIKLKHNEVSVFGDRVYINTNPAARMEIFIHKKHILDKIKNLTHLGYDVGNIQ
jgi:hypothetical protein